MSQHVCEHLRPLEDYLVSLKRTVTASGQVWSANCRFWIYFDAVLDCDALRKKFNLPESVELHANDDPRSGREKGLVCSVDHDAVMGIHPEDAKGARPIA
jgi:hypothetical protein